MIVSEKQVRQTEMFALIEQCRQSGLSKKMFCQENKIAPSLYYYWQKKYKEKSESIDGFVPVKINDAHGYHSPTIEILFPNGVCMRINGPTNTQMLRMLLNLV